MKNPFKKIDPIILWPILSLVAGAILFAMAMQTIHSAVVP